MTGVEVIVAALVAGSAAGSSDAAKSVITDAYTGLRDALRRRLAGRRAAVETLDAVETDPQVWRARLGGALTESGADRDEQVLAAARRLLEAADRGVVIEDHGVHIGTSYGPSASTINGNVSVTYGQVPVPPSGPVA
ncbi:hypothetical protein ACFO1B_48635 [Dactylosporangium siamense]|uniref:RHIM domain-containing protein n=1 Tax=Dactylosporangium siamense TaxID=685454 RepID=A0A919UE53_9ACTN|nr:hypothetical protein [Dactylosporangium siamense]GIG52197.1 hypothetical protein Dsi01nite_102380 [Dactylosporangium siamense]